MVAAPSNAAVDHITEAIARENSAVVRMGNSFKISEKVLPYTLKSQVLNSPLMDVVKRLKKDSEAIRKKAFKYKRNFDKEAYQERKRLRNELKEIKRQLDRARELLSQSDKAISHWERRLSQGFGELDGGFSDLLAAQKKVSEGGDSSFARKKKVKNDQTRKKGSKSKEEEE